MKFFQFIFHIPYSIPYTFVLLLIITPTAFVVFIATNESVQAVGLKVSPLKYEQQIELGSEKTGYIDVSNPNDSTVTVTTDVQAFQQINIDGDLEFYNDAQIEKGIQFDVSQFELAPREAARIFFAIDSNDLPEGGVYAALLFSTGSEQADGRDLSSIGTTSRVGTLLILQNGNNGVQEGEIRNTDIPFWQFGSGIDGTVEFVAAEKEQSIAFEPELYTTMPVVGGRKMGTGLVFPGNTRRFELERSGSYFGIFPVEITDRVTGDTMRTWVFSATGIWQILAPGVLFVVVASIVLQRTLNTPRKRYNRRKKRRLH